MPQPLDFLAAVRRALWLAPLVLLLTIATGSQASARELAAEPLDLRYDMHFGGFTVAEFGLRYIPNGASYRTELVAKTVGLVDRLVGFRGEATSEGVKTDGRAVLPASYRYQEKSNRVSRLERVVFDPATENAVEVKTQKRGIPNQTEVPKALWQGVIDPLTALVRARQQLVELKPRVGTEVVLPVFDGRRRYDMLIEVKGRRQATVAGRRQPVLHLEIEVRALAGFDSDDDKRNLRVAVLVSDDQRLVPLQVRSLDTPITVTMSLAEDCSADGAICKRTLP